MTNIPLDQNSRTGLAAISSTDGSIVPLYADPTTHRLLVDTTGTVALNTIINTTGGTTVLTSAQNNSTSIEVTGVLASNAIIVVSDLKAPFVVENLTTGAFTLTFKTAAGTGVVVNQGTTIMLYANGTNAEVAISTGGGSVTSVSVVTANGVSGSVATSTTTPAITLTLGAITPTSVNGLTFVAAATGFTIAGGTTSKTLTVSNTLTLAGTDTSTLNIGTGGTLGTAAFTAATAYATALSGTINEIAYFNSATTIASLTVATYPSLTELSYVKGLTSAIQTQLNAKGVGDMVLASIQSVTGLKTFDTTKLAVKGSSTGSTAIASANAGATDYTQTLQAKTGTIANQDDVTFIGTTSVALNRASAALVLTGITSIDGSAATLTTTRTIWGQNFNGSANVTGDITLGASSITMTGSIAATGARVTKGWFTDLESTNMPTVGGTAILTSLTAPQFTTIELGHATDTTISRVSAGVIAVEGITVATSSNTLTFTNKRITPRILSAASYTTDTGTSLNCDNLDEFIVTAQAGALKLNNPTGTPTDGQVLFVAVTGTAARALTYDTQFEASTVALPTTTVTTARLNMLFIWRADTSKWVILAAV